MASGEIITTKELLGGSRSDIISTEEMFGGSGTISTDQLFAEPQVDPKQLAETESRAVQLFARLKGRAPSFSPALAAQAGGQLPEGAAIPIPNLSVMGEKRKQEELDRRDAFVGLVKEGYSPKQINLTLQTNKVLEAQKRIRAGKMIGGTVAGLAAGQLVPGPADEAVLLRATIAALGAGAGGATGEAIQTGLEEKRIIGRREALKAFASEAAFEGLGRGATIGVKYLASPFIKKTIPEAAALVDEYAKFGGTFSPTELDNRFSLRVGEGLARGAFGTDRTFRVAEEAQRNTALAFAHSIIDNMVEYSDDVIKNTIAKTATGASKESLEQIGKEFGEGITRPGGRVFRQMDELFDPLYKQLDDLTKGTGVSTSSLKAFRKKVIADNQRLVAQAKRTGKELPLLSSAGAETLKDIDNLPIVVSHSDYRAFRTRILEEGRKLNRDVDVSKSMVKKVASITRDELFNPGSVASASPEAKTLHKNITRLYAATQDALETTFSPQLAKRLAKNPSDVVRAVIPNNNPKAIRQLRLALTNPAGGTFVPDVQGTILWENLRRTWLSNAIEDASKEGIIKPVVYDNTIRKLGPAAFNELFPEPGVAKRAKEIQVLLKAVGKKPPASFSLYTKGIQGVGLIKMYQGQKQGDYVGFTVGGVLAFGPYTIAKMATTPGGVKFLTSGFNIKQGSSAIVPFAARAIKLSHEIDQGQRTEQIKLLKQREVELKARKEAEARTRQGLGPRVPPPTPAMPRGAFRGPR